MHWIRRNWRCQVHSHLFNLCAPDTVQYIVLLILWYFQCPLPAKRSKIGRHDATRRTNLILFKMYVYQNHEFIASYLYSIYTNWASEREGRLKVQWSCTFVLVQRTLSRKNIMRLSRAVVPVPGGWLGGGHWASTQFAVKRYIRMYCGDAQLNILSGTQKQTISIQLYVWRNVARDSF